MQGTNFNFKRRAKTIAVFALSLGLSQHKTTLACINHRNGCWQHDKIALPERVMAMHDKSSACTLPKATGEPHLSGRFLAPTGAQKRFTQKSQSPLARRLIIYTFVFGLALIFCGPRGPSRLLLGFRKIKFSGVSRSMGGI